MKVFKDQKYWYKVYKNAIYPVLKEYVDDTEKVKWDDAVLASIDFVVEKLLGPNDASLDA